MNSAVAFWPEFFVQLRFALTVGFSIGAGFAALAAPLMALVWIGQKVGLGQ